MALRAAHARASRLGSRCVDNAFKQGAIAHDVPLVEADGGLVERTVALLRAETMQLKEEPGLCYRGTGMQMRILSPKRIAA